MKKNGGLIAVPPVKSPAHIYISSKEYIVSRNPFILIYIIFPSYKLFALEQRYGTKSETT
jgi:hypothetical protein